MTLRVEPVRGAPGVGRVAVPSPTLPPATTTNCWLLGTDDVVAVDPAGVTAEARVALAGALGGRRVRGIFLTHHHFDHVGGAEDLRARTGAPILAHPETASRVPLTVDVLVPADGAVDTCDGPWTALHTPGHAPGHLCLRSPDGTTIVAGDLVAGEGTIVLDPPEGDLGLYLDSLSRVAALAPARLLPAHGPAIAPAVPLLEHYIAHRHQRTAQIRAALAALDGARPDDLVPGIYPELPVFFRPVAARQVLCHLLWLVERGDATRTGDRFHIAGGAP